MGMMGTEKQVGININKLTYATFVVGVSKTIFNLLKQVTKYKGNYQKK